MRKKVITFLACLMMILSFIPSTSILAEDGTELEMVSRSKTATELDSDNESTVTLSLPSAEEQLTSDVVFVLDKSSCKKETAEKASALLNDLYDQVTNHGAKINVGVIVFGGNSKISYEMQEFPTTDEGLLALTNALTTRPSGLMSGTNMHGGLLAAKAMLEESTTDDSRKHVILVSDGLTRLFTGSDGKTKDIYYQFSYSDMMGQKEVGTGEDQIHPKNCVYFGMIGEWEQVRNQTTQTGTYAVPYGDWDTYFSKVEAWVAADGDTYALDFETYGNDPTNVVKDSATGDIVDENFVYIGHTDYENHAMVVDRAVYEAYHAFADLVDAGNKCYTVLNGHTEFGEAFMGAMNEYAGNGEVDFATIGQDILYAVGAGSVVEDKMGADFDFVEGSLELTVGEDKLDSNTVGNVTYFGENASEDNFRFKVVYDKSEDAFVWYINENVSNFAPVQLSYKVKLMNIKKEAGTYEVATNEYAVLRVVDSEGQELEGLLEFPVPTVSYTVKAQPSTGDNISIKLLASVMMISAAATMIIVDKKKKSLK